MLEIIYKSKPLYRICTNFNIAQQKYSVRMAKLIHRRVDELHAADSEEMLVRYSIGRCHPLEGSRKGEYAMDLVHPYRLVFEHNKAEIQIARIISIEDYH